MTEKRFGYGAGVNWQEDVIIDYETEKSYDFYEVGKLLNELAEENQDLRILLNQCSDQRNEFHRGARENANRVGQLEKENKELRSDREYWKTLARNNGNVKQVSLNILPKNKKRDEVWEKIPKQWRV